MNFIFSARLRAWLAILIASSGSSLKYFLLNKSALEAASNLLKDQLDGIYRAAAKIGRCAIEEIEKEAIQEIFFLQVAALAQTTAQKMQDELSGGCRDDYAKESLAIFAQVIKSWSKYLGPNQDPVLSITTRILLQSKDVAAMTIVALQTSDLLD